MRTFGQLLCRAGWTPVLLLGAGAVYGAQLPEEDEFPVSNSDVIVLKNGVVLSGRRQESSDRTRIEIRLLPSNIIQSVDLAEVKEVRLRATPEQAVERVLAAQPERTGLLCQKALRKFAGNRAVEAMVLKALEAAAPGKDPDVLALLAERYLAAGDPQSAEKTARMLVARKDSAQAQCLLGQALAGQGKEKDADAALAKALKLAPEDEDIMVKYAEFLLSVGRPAEALKIFTDALAKNSRSVPAMTGKGYVLLRQGEIDAALESFDRALAGEQKPIRAKLGLAACKALKKDFPEAYRFANDVLNTDPNNARAFGLQAYARLMQGGEDEKTALFRLEDALKVDPHEPRYQIAKAVVLDRAAEALTVTGKPADAAPLRDEAAKLLAEVGESKAPDSWAQYLIAEMRFRQGDYETARAGFRRAAELESSYAPAHEAIGATDLALMHWRDAEQAYRRALELDAARPGANAGLGLALLGQGRIPEAREFLKKALQADANNVAALCGLGYIANAEKNEGSVKELFHQALAADGTCEYAAKALKELYAFRGLRLDYLTLDKEAPPKWTVKGTGALKPVIANGELTWHGTQGPTPSVKCEFCTDLKAADFVRFESDLEISADSPAAVGLRLASGSGSVVSFEFEFGKDKANHLAYRVRDYGGARPWTAMEPWPASGKVRLAIEPDGDLGSGDPKFFVYVNGVSKGHVPMRLQRPGKMVAGVFLQAPAKAVVDAHADNLVLVSRQSPEELEGPAPGELVPPEPKKAGEPDKAAPAPEKAAPGSEKAAPAPEKATPAEPEKKAAEPEQKVTATDQKSAEPVKAEPAKAEPVKKEAPK